MMKLKKYDWISLLMALLLVVLIIWFISRVIT